MESCQTKYLPNIFHHFSLTSLSKLNTSLLRYCYDLASISWQDSCIWIQGSIRRSTGKINYEVTGGSASAAAVSVRDPQDALSDVSSQAYVAVTPVAGTRPGPCDGPRGQPKEVSVRVRNRFLTSLHM